LPPNACAYRLESSCAQWLKPAGSFPSLGNSEDVLRIRSHPLVPKTIPVYGYIYDVRTGRLIEVPDA
jgi:carbonic anhydrase